MCLDASLGASSVFLCPQIATSLSVWCLRFCVFPPHVHFSLFLCLSLLPPHPLHPLGVCRAQPAPGTGSFLTPEPLSSLLTLPVSSHGVIFSSQDRESPGLQGALPLFPTCVTGMRAFLSVTALQRKPYGSWSPSLLHELRMGPFLPHPVLTGWASLLISFLVVSQENQRPLAPSFKDLELPWVKEIIPNPTWPGASLPTSVGPISLQTVFFL